MKMVTSRWCVVGTACAALLWCLPAGAQHDEMMPADRPGSVMFMISPLYGWNHCVYEPASSGGSGGAAPSGHGASGGAMPPGSGGPGGSTPSGAGRPTGGSSDTDAEAALFAMLVTPRLIANNIYFRTEPTLSGQKTRVSGDIASVNVYGSPESRLTWNLGAGYVWHEIENDTVTTTVDMPLGKAGLVWRIPGMHLMFNPYIGYAREQVDAEISMGPTTMEESDSYNVMLYGVSCYWRWRMLQANVKYYIQDNRGLNKSYDVVRGQFSAMFTRHVGILLRGERMEESSTTDTSFVAGPIVVF